MQCHFKHLVTFSFLAAGEPSDGRVAVKLEGSMIRSLFLIELSQLPRGGT